MSKDRPESNSSRAVERPKRVPLSRQSKLKAEQRPGYHRRFVNDTGGRVQAFIEAGYTPVVGTGEILDSARAQDPSLWGSSVVKVAVGGDVKAVLMEIPLEFYQEDQEAKQQLVDEIEESYDPTRRVSKNTYGTRFRQTKGN